MRACSSSVTLALSASADPEGDVALRREDVHALAIVLFGPDHLSRLRVDQLDVHAHAGAVLAHGAA